MKSDVLQSSKLGHPADSSDMKHVSGLSTLLVATIQEAKDRISQIEYIFCSQLFPKFQLNSHSIQKIYSEARDAAEDAFKENEKDLLLQIKKLQCEKQQVLEENQMLKLEKEKFINMEQQSGNRFNGMQKELKQRTMEVNKGKETQENLQKLLESKVSLLHSYEKTIQELERKDSTHLKMQKRVDVEIEELRHELMKKSKEVDEVMELQNKLLQINQSKASLIGLKEIQMKEYEEKISGLTSKLENMENKVNELQTGLRDKTREVDKGKEMQGNLLRKIEFQDEEIMKKEELLNKHLQENRLLAERVECLDIRTDELQKELTNKSLELEAARKEQEQLLQQCNLLNCEVIKRGEELENFEKENKQLLDKKKGLEDKVDKLQQSFYERTKESSDGMQLHGKLLQQIEIKDSELLSEKRKRKDVIAAYKKMKSQYTYLCKKYALTQETMPPLDQMEDKNEIIRQNHTPVTSRDIENNVLKASGVSSETTKPECEQEPLEDKKGDVLVQKATPSSNSLVAPKLPSSIKSCPPAGAKRPSSYWRDTRSHHIRVGPDPHDDFLDTPQEKVRENLVKVVEDNLDFPKLSPISMSLDNSDDETQDMNVDARTKEPHVLPPKAGPSGFKYVEPVRKKSEREGLKGVECMQCKKFYDAVLPDAGRDSDSEKQNTRCEHLNVVSRHRYRYAPPLTPEGFWNIGFESEK